MLTNQQPDQTQKEHAKELLSQGRLEAARELLSELCTEGQGDIEIWSLYIVTNGQLGKFEDVIAACRKALEIEAHYLPALNGLASALAAMQRYPEAAAQFATLLSLAPDNPWVLNNYGHTLFLMGSLLEARRILEDAVRIHPQYAEAHYNLATLLEHSGQTAEALREYELAAALKPGLPGLSDRISRLYNPGMTNAP